MRCGMYLTAARYAPSHTLFTHIHIGHSQMCQSRMFHIKNLGQIAETVAAADRRQKNELSPKFKREGKSIKTLI